MSAHRPSRAQPVLLIEDTASLQILYTRALELAGYAVRSAATAASGLEVFHQMECPVVLLDLMLPDGDGLLLMAKILAHRPATQVVVITANGSINRAVEAMRAGAHEFLVKPFDEARLIAAVGNAFVQGAGAQGGTRGAKSATPTPATAMPVKAAKAIHRAAGTAGPLPAGAFVGSSPAMERTYAKIASVARSMATVFITGESGTGKELAAMAVHGGSNRANGPFIALNCGAIPQDLLESEVFGHIKGSFPGAISDKQGAAQAADGGTLFLDEICEMAPALQSKLLRFLQTSSVHPVGAARPRKVNVRIVCATNRDPLDAVRRGQFREDLYYRLFVVPIHMPPLRQRGEDVIEIADNALHHFAEEEGRHFLGLSSEVADLFRHLPWPGNVRQVLNVMRNVAVLNEGGLVTRDMLPDDLTRSPEAAAPAPTDTATTPATLAGLIGKSMAEIERTVIEATLDLHDGSVPKAARMLEISPSTLYRKIEAWGRRSA